MATLEDFASRLQEEPKKETCFMTLGKYLEENKISGNIKGIDYKKTPLCEYTNSEGKHRVVKGIVLFGAKLPDGTQPQLATLGTSERLGSNPINKVAEMLSACRVRKDIVITQDEEGQEVKKEYWCLCSPQETETEGNTVEVSL